MSPEPKRAAVANARTPQQQGKELRTRDWIKPIGSLVLFLGIVAVCGILFRKPLEAMGHWFVGRCGLAGTVVGTFLADGIHIPIPPEFYMLAEIVVGQPPGPVLIAICAGSLVGGFFSYIVGKKLATSAS